MQLFLSVLVYMMVQSVLFGVGVVVILATPLADSAEKLMVPMVIATMLLSALPAWMIAARMRLSNSQVFHLWHHVPHTKTHYTNSLHSG